MTWLTEQEAAARLELPPQEAGRALTTARYKKRVLWRKIMGVIQYDSDSLDELDKAARKGKKCVDRSNSLNERNLPAGLSTSQSAEQLERSAFLRAKQIIAKQNASSRNTY